MNGAKHVCRECGKDIGHMSRKATFCGAEHRKAWHNRRMIRGAELYDLYMALRYQRQDAKAKQAMTVLSNLARAFRDADVAKREGRLSWDIDEALERLPLAYSAQGDKR